MPPPQPLNFPEISTILSIRRSLPILPVSKTEAVFYTQSPVPHVHCGKIYQLFVFIGLLHNKFNQLFSHMHALENFSNPFKA